MNLRRVLILADESADWIVAGLRQLDRLALAIDEFAVENNETAPVLVCILWRPDVDQARCWTPANQRLTMVAFTTDLDDEPYDLVVTTHLFLYRKGIRPLLAGAAPLAMQEPLSWENCLQAAQLREPFRPGAWEQIASPGQIDDVERKFLRGSGKLQDGFVSRYLNRPISRTITRLALRHPITPTAWTWLIFPVPIIGAFLLVRGTYWSFLWGLALFQLFSVLDGCDGEIARAKFMESERGRQLDDLFDVVSNILLGLGLGVGLRYAHPGFGWLFLAEGIAAAVLIALSEWVLAGRKPVAAAESKDNSLGAALYPRHRDLVERSGLLVFGEKFASLVIQLTKRDVAVLFFVFLAAIGMPALILHLVFVVTAVTLLLTWRARQVVR